MQLKNGVTSDEPGEFRVIVDDESDDLEMIAETIGIRYVVFLKNPKEGTYVHIENEGNSDTTTKTIDVAKELKGSFAIENILGANKEMDCEQSPLKDSIESCELAILRAVSEEEKSRLQELRSKAFGLQSLKLKLRPSNLHNLLMKLT